MYSQFDRKQKSNDYDDENEDGAEEDRTQAYSRQNRSIQNKSPISSQSGNQKRNSNNNSWWDNEEEQNNERDEEDIYAGNPKYSAQNYYQREQANPKHRLNNQQPPISKKKQIKEDEDEDELAYDDSKQQQLRDQGRLGNSNKPPKSSQNDRMVKRYQKVEEGLQICPEGCGRTFNEFALEKHVKICKNVFQDKRKVFESTQMKITNKQSDPSAIQTDEKRQELLRKQKEMHECPDCGRQFRYDVYEKHIKICLRVFPKKQRENSLQRKALNQTSQQPQPQIQNSKPQQQQQQQQDSLKNMKKPPLKKQGSSNEQPKQDAQDEKTQKSTSNKPLPNNPWDDIPVGPKKNNKIGNEWDEYPQELPKKSKGNSWDDETLPAQKNQSKNRFDDENNEYSNLVNSQQSKDNPWSSQNKGAQKKQQEKKVPWNDDWNNDTKQDNNDNMEEQINANKKDKKNYNFNQQKAMEEQARKSKNSLIEEEEYQESSKDKYLYTKPNIGRQIIQSASKNQNKYDSDQQYQEQEDQQSKPQFSKPFLKKNAGNQAASRSKNPYDYPLEDEKKQVRDEERNVTFTPNAKEQGFKSSKNEEPRKNKKPEIPSKNSAPPPAKNYPNSSKGNGKVEVINMGYNEQEDIPLNKGNNNNDEFLEMENVDSDDIQLFQCPEGCNRKFQRAALERHRKVCKKVFQQKRKAFDSASHRQVDDPNSDGISKPPPPIIKKQPPKQPPKQARPRQQDKNEDYEESNNQKKGYNPFEKKKEDVNTKVGKKKPDWKLQSEAFRAVMRQAKGQTTHSEYDNAIIKEAFQRDDYVSCDSCGRRFNEQAAEKHIPFCKQKSELNRIKQGPPKSSKNTGVSKQMIKKY